MFNNSYLQCTVNSAEVDYTPHIKPQIAEYSAFRKIFSIKPYDASDVCMSFYQFSFRRCL